jgi:hypothetical protein
MASQKEHLEGAKVDELRNFAAENEIDLEGATTKAEIVDKIAASRKAPAEEVKDTFPLDEEEETDEDTEDEEEEETQPGGPTATPAEEAGESRAMRHSVSPDRVTREPEALLDPSLTDPEGVARDRVEGRTSDPANRVEGVTAAEVPADLSEGPKQSDAGPEAYPFPPGGDVDVSLVDPGNSSEEYDPPLNVDDWVILDGAHELVPDRLDGHMAYVIEAPNQTAPDVHDHPNAALTPVPDAGIKVRTRDEVNATLILPFEAFKAVGKGGRSAVLPVG